MTLPFVRVQHARDLPEGLSVAIYALGEHTPSLPAPDRVLGGRPARTSWGACGWPPDVGVWFGAVLRGDNDLIDIGAGSNVQEGAMLHTDIGFPHRRWGLNVTVGHHAILHGCTIGDGSLIGMGATVMNGARIGAGCLVGAGALVTEGKTFPDGSLIVGSPAVAKRALDAAAIAGLRRSAENYAANWKRFRAELRRIDS